MFKKNFNKIAIGVLALLILGGVGYKLFTPASLSLAATTQNSDVVALITTSLQAPISSTATTMTLNSGTYNNGATTLASSTYGFIIDEGTSIEEIVLADCTGATCTNITRGINRGTGTTTVVALEFAHRRGASVKITDAPSLVFMANAFRGKQNIENALRYNSNLTFTDTKQLVSKKYVDDTAFSGAGVVDATTAARGVVELATTAETAASTAVGGSGNLAIANSTATSTYNSATAANRVVVTDGTGKIDTNFLPTTATFATSSLTVGSFSAYNIGKNEFFSSTTGATTFTVPTGITKVYFELSGAGAAGGGPGGGNAGLPGGGGGAAGSCTGMIDVTGVSTLTYSIGAKGTGSVGGSGTDGAYSYLVNGATVYCSAAGGSGGDGAGNAGTGGNATTTLSSVVTRQGQTGGMGLDAGTVGISGSGGSNPFGSGGPAVAGGASSVAGLNAFGFGSGGGGGIGAAAGGNAGGDGKSGFLRIRW